MTSVEPPLSFLDDQGRLTGLSVDVLREIQERVGNRDPIQIMPWVRVYQTAFDRPNTVALTMARTEEREELFEWICLVNRNAWMLFAKRGAGIVISELEEAKEVDSIGVIRGDARETLLLNLGFRNLETVTEYEQNIRKLLADRLSLIFYAASGAVETCRKIGVDYRELETVYTIKVADAYIVMSKDTDPAVVEAWREAAGQMKRDGTFDRIARKWIGYLRGAHGFETHLKEGGLNLWEEP